METPALYRWRRIARACLCAALLTAATAACGPASESGSPVTLHSDTGVDATPDTSSNDTGEARDTGTVRDSGAEDTRSIDSGDVADTSTDATTDATPDTDVLDPLECRTASPNSAAEPTEIDTGSWVFGKPSGSGNSLLLEAVRNENFTPPSEGETKYGTSWKSVSPTDDGSIDHPDIPGGRRLVYAATTIEVDQPTTVVAKADDLYRVYVGGAPQAADVYGHGDKRVPLDLDAGKNAVVLQFLNRQTPKFEIWETSDPVFYNTKDLTSPELRVGSSTDQPVGLALLNVSGQPLYDVEARVVENQHFEATTVEYPAVGPDAVTQIAFDLQPKSTWSTPGQKIPVTLAVTSCRSTKIVRKTIELKTVERGSVFRRTFRSPVDASAQYYAVVPPKNFDPNRDYGLALALHGAAVEAEGHAEAYSRKEWLYIAAPTNRRRYGFNWESFGRLNGLNALEHARDSFTIDPARIYVTGHSMGGHGTWHFGVMNPGQFATIGPSAGWASIYTYTGADRPQGAFSRARAHSATNNYLSNLADRGAYIIHGGADNNVPTQEGRDLRDALRKYTDDVKYHEEPGAKHWWDGDRADGTDCVDWPPLFEFFKNHTRDPTALEFSFKSPGPWYSDSYSYVRVRSSQTPYEDFQLESTKTGPSTVELTTTNVRSMDISGTALFAKGIRTLVVDGTSHQVSVGTIEIGPRDGKRPGQNGTFNQVFQKPFCFVYPKYGPEEYRQYAAYLTSVWSVRGNGHACAMPVERVDQQVRSERNLVYLGVPFDRIPNAQNRPFGWRSDQLEIGSWSFDNGVELVVFPDGDDMAAAVFATKGAEQLVFRHQPFTSRANLPDYLVFSGQGGLATGFFDNQWSFDPDLGARAQ